jgi:hypothetical protein
LDDLRKPTLAGQAPWDEDANLIPDYIQSEHFMYDNATIRPTEEWAQKY